MADPNAHAGTIADPIPQQLLYKNAKDGKIYTVAGAASSSSAPAPKVENANETTKGITKLSDAIDSDSDAATGVTAATPKAVKAALEQAKAYTDANSSGTGTTVDATDTVKGISKLSDATDSALDASTGKTAATPKAVKDAMNVAKLALAQAGGVVTPDAPPKVELPGTIIEPATDKKIGTVKLSDATNSSSDAATGKTAASSKAVMEAMDKAKEALRVAQAGGGGQIVSVEDATDAVKGIVSLSDATDSELDAATGKFAATPKAVKAAMDKANEALALAGGNPDGNPIEGTKIESATDAKLGVTKLSDETASNADAATGTTAATPKAVMKAYDLANKAFKLAEANAGTAGGGSIALPDDADATTKGVVKLSDAVNSDSNVDGLTAATPKAVKTALEQAKAYADTLGGGGGSGPTVDATDAVKGVSKLSDAIDSDLNAATGATAASPKAVKTVAIKVTAVEEKNIEQDRRLVAIENKNLDTAAKLKEHNATLADHGQRIEALENSGGNTTIVLVPKITAPAQNEVDVLTTFTITGSAYQTLLESDKRKHRRFEASKSPSFDIIAWSTELNADEAEVAPAFDESSDYYLRIRDVSQQGYTSPWSIITKITTGGASKVSKPTVSISGKAEATKETPTFTGSTFAIEPEDLNDPQQHVSTTWTLRKVEGNSVVWTSTDDTVNKTSITLSRGLLQVSTKYIMEMSYTSTDHGSSAIAKVEFTTVAEFTHVVPPTITIDEGTTDVAENPTLTGSAFDITPKDDGESDTHASTTWWITKRNGGDEVWRVDQSVDNKTSITVPRRKLEVSTEYTAHVIYTGTTYGNSAEATLNFTTAAEFTHIQTPTITIEASDADGGDVNQVTSTPTFRGTAFTIVPSKDTDTHTSSTWWITYKSGREVYRLDKDTSKLTTMTLPAGRLEPSQDYIVHLIYHGAEWGDSNEATLSFRTADNITGIRVPLIKGENDADLKQYDIGTVIELIEAKDFSKPNNHIDYTEWEIYKADTKIWSSAASTNWKFLTLITTQLEPSTTYKIRVRQRIESSSYSDWSEGYFTTKDTLNYPTFRFKMKDKVNIKKIVGSITPSYYEFYIDDVLSEDLKSKWDQDYTLSNAGQWIKLVRVSETSKYYYDFPFIAFSGIDGSLAGNLLDVDDIPWISKSTCGCPYDSSSPAHAGVGKTADGTEACGWFSKCTSLTSIPETVFKYNQQLSSASGIGGNGGRGQDGANGGSGDHGASLFVDWEIDYGNTNGSKGSDGSNGSGTGGNGYGCFFGCTGLTSLPENLFKYNYNLQYLYGQGGSGGRGGDGGSGGRGGIGVKSHSSKKAQTISRSGYSGGNGGNGGNGSGNGGNGYGCFADCTGLTSLPENLFKYNPMLRDLSGKSDYDKDGRGGDGGSGGNGVYVHNDTSNLVSLNLSGSGGNGGQGGNGGAGSGRGGNGYGCFYGCTGLTTLPENLFRYNYNLSNVGADVRGSVGGRGGDGGSGGNGIDTYAARSNVRISYGNGGRGNAAGHGTGGGAGVGGDAYGCFANCTGLTSLPENLFKYCTKLDNVGVYCTQPSNTLNTAGGNGGNGGTGCYAYDNKGGSFSSGRGGNGSTGGNGGKGSTYKAGNGYGCFYGCTGLTTLPEDLFKFNSALTKVGGNALKDATGPASGSTGSNGGIGSGSGGVAGGTGGTGGAAGSYDMRLQTEHYGAFGKCNNLNLQLRFNGAVSVVGNFAQGIAARGTVYVPRGSTSATSFKSDPTANVNVIEEDIA